MINARLQEIEGAATGVESPELESLGADSHPKALDWAEAALAGENRILEMIARSDSLCSILDALCRLVEQMSSGALCSISLLDATGAHLCSGAAPSLPQAYTDAVVGRTIADGWGP